MSSTKHSKSPTAVPEGTRILKGLSQRIRLLASPSDGIAVRKSIILQCGRAAAAEMTFYVHAEEPQRQSEVAQRGAEVMPFSLGATTHIFSDTSDGGTQRVVAKNPSDKTQVRLIREHLRSIGEQFRNGDFSAPSQTHGDDMPGLAQLKAAKPGQISIGYKTVRAGGQLTFRTRDATLVVALHEWFGAQLSDHGPDAIEGQQQHHGGMQTQ